MDLPPPEVTDAELLRKTAAGDRDAFARLYDRTSPVLFSIARRILRDDTMTEDLLQDVYIQVWEKAASFDRSIGKPMTWLITLTRNRAIDRLRATQRLDRAITAAQQEIETGQSDRTDPPADAELDGDQRRSIRTALGQLPAEQRQAIELAFFSGLTQVEIAEKLGTPLGTIKARIRRGLIQMRDALRFLTPTG